MKYIIVLIMFFSIKSYAQQAACGAYHGEGKVRVVKNKLGDSLAIIFNENKTSQFTLIVTNPKEVEGYTGVNIKAKFVIKEKCNNICKGNIKNIIEVIPPDEEPKAFSINNILIPTKCETSTK